MKPHRAILPAVLLLAACAAPRDGAEDTWGNRLADVIDPVVPDSLRIGSRVPALKPELNIDPVEFPDRKSVV